MSRTEGGGGNGALSILNKDEDELVSRKSIEFVTFEQKEKKGKKSKRSRGTPLSSLLSVEPRIREGREL